MTIHPSTFGMEEADPFAPVDLPDRERVEPEDLTGWPDYPPFDDDPPVSLADAEWERDEFEVKP